MRTFPKLSGVLLLIASATLCLAEDTPKGNKRPARALPSVSGDHYSEVLSDGTYKYAYTGEHRYVAERRLADGTVEGESLYVRPDGIPIKVHYFADKAGYRPKTEVLYKERVVSTRTASPHVVREVLVPAPGPAVILAPPRSSGSDNSVNVNLGNNARSGYEGFDSRNSVNVNLGNTRSGVEGLNLDSRGGDVAAAVPSVTAIVGPGGRAVVRPEAIARTSGSSKYFRSAGSGGDIAIANPHTTAIVGPGGSVVVEPKAAAYAGNSAPEVVREVHHHTQQVVTPVERVVERYVQPVATPVRTVVARPVPVETRGYVYAQPAAFPARAIRTDPQQVLIVPPSSRYSYSYGYNAPDPKHPQRDNSAYVNVQVNQ